MRDADGNLRLNRISPGNVRLLTSRVEDALKRMPRESFDLVILDPPPRSTAIRMLAAGASRGLRSSTRAARAVCVVQS